MNVRSGRNASSTRAIVNSAGSTPTTTKIVPIAAAGRQVWLQSLPADQVPACGPSLEYMLETFAANEVLAELLKGSGE